MNEENFKRLITTGAPLPPEEIATDENLDLWTKESQFKGDDEWTMTADKLAGKTAGMGAASLQLPDGLAQHYDRNKWREEDEEILRSEQEAHHEHRDRRCGERTIRMCSSRADTLPGDEGSPEDGRSDQHHRGEHERPSDRSPERDQGTQGTDVGTAE